MRAVSENSADHEGAVRCLWEVQAVLGEGPVWEDRSQCLRFVDIEGARLLSYRNDGSTAIQPFDGGLSAVFVTPTGRLLCATTRGLVSFDPTDAQCRFLRRIEHGRSGNRTNDGKCDPSGRVWIGTMDATERAFTGALYRIDRHGHCTRVLDEIGVSNGLDWSPDGTVFYYTDSKRGLIWRFPFDMTSGALGSRSVFAQVPRNQGVPDGLTVDADGFIWSAHWDGWRVTRYDPDGAVERVIGLPVPRVTSLCFGGPQLDTLYITSARIGLTGEQLRAAPLSGGLFGCRPGVRGQPANQARIDVSRVTPC
jgi:sugar lactone lactonase YvrE